MSTKETIEEYLYQPPEFAYPLASTLLAFIIPLYLIGTIVFFLRRSIYPIKGRSHLLVIATGTSTIVFVLAFLFLFFSKSVDCNAYIDASLLSLGFMFGFLILRLGSLKVRFELAHERINNGLFKPPKKPKDKTKRTATLAKFKLQMRDGLKSIFSSPKKETTTLTTNQDSHSGKDVSVPLEPIKETLVVLDDTKFWYTNRTYLESNKFRALIVFCEVFISYAPKLFTPGQCEAMFFVYSYYMYVFILINLIVLVIISRKLRTLVDGFKIREEFHYSSYIVFFMAVAYAINLLTESFFSFPLARLAMAIGEIMYLSLIYVWPIYLSYKAPPVIEAPPASIATLDLMLQNEQAVEAFEKFLFREMNIENLLFWREIEQLHKLGDKLEACVAVGKSKSAPGTDEKQQNLALFPLSQLSSSIGSKESESKSSQPPTSVERSAVFTSSDNLASPNAAQRQSLQVPGLFEEKRSFSDDVKIKLRPSMYSERLESSKSEFESDRRDLSNLEADELAYEIYFRSEAIFTAIEEIFQKYILVGAISELNLVAELRERIAAAYHSNMNNRVIDVHVFDEVQAVVFDLMKFDSFHRFQRSDEYKELHQSVANAERKNEVLKDLHVI